MYRSTTRIIPFFTIVALCAAVLFSVPGYASGMLDEEDGKDPVVLVHGYCGSVLGELSVEGYWLYVGNRFKLDGYDIHKITLGNGALQDVRTSAGELKNYIQNVRSSTGRNKVDIVAHSEGGLVAKYYIKYLGGAPYVDDLVTISTPHRGTTVAHIGPGKASRQMEVYSDFLREMNSEWDFPGSIDYTAIHSNHDEIVFPPANGFFRGAVNMNVNMLGHAGILANEKVYRMAKGAVSTNIKNNHRALPIEIVKDSMTTNNPNVTLRLRKADHLHTGTGMEEMMIDDQPYLHGGDYESFKSTKSWRLDTSMNGLKAVYVRYRKKGGFLQMDKKSPVYVDYIFYDSKAPSCSLDIEQEITLDTTVSLSIDADDNSDNFKKFKVWNALTAYGIDDLGVKEMMVSADAGFSGAAWQPYSGSASLDLGPGSGVRTVYLKVRDGAGNESPVVTDTVRVIDPDAGDIGMISEGDSDPVVLVHGYGGSVAGDVSSYVNWVYIYEKLKHEGFDVHRITLSAGGLQDVTKSAAELKDFVADVLADTGRTKVDIVCHSEGGLVARYYIQEMGGAAGVDDLVTISTPHRGTTVASIGPGKAARQMEVASPFLQNLNSGDTLPGDVSYTALFSHADEIVLPGKNGFFDGAVNVNYTMFGHASILFHIKPYTVVRNALSNNYLFDKGQRPVEILEDGMSTSAETINVRLRACNHYSPRSPVTEMKVATNGMFHGASWQPFNEDVAIDVSGEGEGLLGVHVKFRGSDGEESPSYADYILLDRSAPDTSVEVAAADPADSSLKLKIDYSDNSDRYSGINPRNVLESYGITGAGAREMMVSAAEDFAGASWQPAAGSLDVSVEPGFGMRTVYVKLRDAAGNETSPISASAYMFDSVNGYMAMENDSDPVVLVHGYGSSIVGDVSSYISWSYYVGRLEADGFDTHVVTLSAAGMQDITASAAELDTFIDGVISETGARKVDIVCHSMGGLVSRYYIKKMGGSAYVDDLVTIATPHRGTVVAAIGPGRSARQMEVGSDFINALNSVDTTPGTVDYTAVHANNDEMVVPQQNGFFDGAVNINMNVYEHATILFNDETYGAVRGALGLDVGHEAGELPVHIDSDSMVTSSADVELTLNYYNHYAPQYPPGDMMISNDKHFTGAGWQPFANSIQWKLNTMNDGLKAVYVKYRAAETGAESPVYVDYIVLDRTPPDGSVSAVLNPGDAHSADLTISASDNSDTYARLNPAQLMKSYGIRDAGLKAMMLWNTPDFSGALWEDVAGTRTWPLLEKEEDRTVYVKFVDHAGNESRTLQASVKWGGTTGGGDTDDEADGDAAGETDETPGDQIEQKIMDVVTEVDLESGWNLVYLPDGIPENMSEIIMRFIDSMETVVDFSLLKNSRNSSRSALTVIEKGKAVWVYSGEPVARRFSYRAEKGGPGNMVALNPGWNVIGLPGHESIDVDDIEIVLGADRLTFDEAAEQRLVDEFIYTYEDGGYERAATLAPAKAYLLKVFQPCLIELP